MGAHSTRTYRKPTNRPPQTLVSCVSNTTNTRIRRAETCSDERVAPGNPDSTQIIRHNSSCGVDSFPFLLCHLRGHTQHTTGCGFDQNRHILHLEHELHRKCLESVSWYLAPVKFDGDASYVSSRYTAPNELAEGQRSKCSEMNVMPEGCFTSAER